jgi:DNA-binding IclR family transcriptional regulator
MVITFVRHGNTVGGANEGANEGVNEGVNALLTLIDKKPGLRAPELAHQLKAPAKTVERWLKQLRLENRIKFVGPSKTGGYYAT